VLENCMKVDEWKLTKVCDRVRLGRMRSTATLRASTRANALGPVCAVREVENAVSRRSLVFGLVGAAVVLPGVALAEEEKRGTEKEPKDDGGVKDCDSPPKPKGEEVCEVDY
jgi:hypothetical protein